MSQATNRRARAFVAAMLAVCAVTAWAAIEAYIHELRDKPSVYNGKVVDIEGKVTDVQPGETRITESSYTLLDDFGDKIVVKTDDLPSINSTVRVRGFVALDAVGAPFLYERERSGAAASWPA